MTSFTTFALQTYSANNVVQVSSVANMVSGVPITFTGTAFGNIVPGANYYVGNITAVNSITLTTLPGGATWPVADGTGNMTATFTGGGQEVINTGTAPDDGTGSPLRTAFTDTNVNFDQIFAAGPVGSNVQIVNNTILTTNTNGNLVLNPNGIGAVVANAHVIPDTANIRNLGSQARRFATVYTQYLDVNQFTNLTITTANLHILGGSNGYVLQTDGTGNLTWTAQTGGSGNATPAGANTQVQYNNAGNLGATAGFTFDKTSNALSVPGTITASNFVGANLYSPNTGTNIQINDSNVVIHPDSYPFGSSWTFDRNGTLTLPVEQGSSNGLIAAAPTTGITLQTLAEYNVVGAISSGSGYSTAVGVATTGGNGTGLTVDIVVAGVNNYIQSVVVNNPGTGYLDGDSISITGGDNNGGFILQNPNSSTNSTTFNWTFDAAGNLTAPGNIFGNAITLKNTDDFNQIVFSDNGGGNDNGHIKVDGGTNMIVSSNNNFYVKRNGQDRIAVTDTTSDFGAATNVRIQSNKAGSAYTWTFDNAGNLSIPGALNHYVVGNLANLAINSWTPIVLTTGDIVDTGIWSWTFGTDGNLAAPNNISAVGTVTAGGFTTSGNITGANYVTANVFALTTAGTGTTSVIRQNQNPPVGSEPFGIEMLTTSDTAGIYSSVSAGPDYVTLNSSNGGNANIVLQGGYGVTVSTTDPAGGNEKDWTFGTDGNLTLPTNSSNINYANGISILDGIGGGSYGNANVATFLADFGNNAISMTGNVYSGNFAVTANLDGALNSVVEITANGVQQTPTSPGVMMHITGQTGVPTRILYDGANSYVSWSSRVYAGTPTAPVGVGANTVLSRYGANPYTSTGWNSNSSVRMDMWATEAQTATNRGSKIVFTVTPNGSNVSTDMATVSGTGVSIAGNVTANYFVTTATVINGNISTAGNIVGNGSLTVSNDISTAGNIYSSNIISATGNIYTSSSISANGNVRAGNFTTNGTISTAGNVFASGVSVVGNIVANNMTLSSNLDGNLNSVMNILADGAFQPVSAPGTMLHITGQTGVQTRFIADGANNYVTYTNRIYGGTPSAPTAVAANTLVVRYGANPYLGTGWTGNSSARIDMWATEAQTAANRGSSIVIAVTSNGNSVIGNVATFTGTGLSVAGNITGNYFIGNGSQLTGLPSSYTNSNVSTLLSAYGNTISTTGNVFANVISTSGNVRGANINTAGLVTATGNIVTAGNFIGNGAALSNVTVSVAGNVIGTQSNVTLVAGSYTYTFDNTGTFTMPVNGNIVMPGANTNLTVGGNLTVTGNITSTPVGFRATTPVTNMTVNNGSTVTMLFGTEEVDTNSAYNPATGRFTPNAAGYYSIDWFVVTNANGAGEMIASLYKNGVLVAWGTNQTTATAHWNGIGGSAGMIYLNGTTDYISISLTNNSGSTATILAASGLSYFSAYLIR